ncbi:hypothetical protein LPJ73_001253, partial [Coemansia sp. RSA 2703]
MDGLNQKAVSDVSHEDVATEETPPVIRDGTVADDGGTSASFSAGGSERADAEVELKVSDAEAAAAEAGEGEASSMHGIGSTVPFHVATEMQGVGMTGMDDGSSSGQNYNNNIHIGSNINSSSILATDIDLDFNVDSINLDSLNGLDFDVSNLLSQVSGSTMAAVVGSGGGSSSGVDAPHASIRMQEPGSQIRAPVLSAMAADGAQHSAAPAVSASSVRPPSAAPAIHAPAAVQKQPQSAMSGPALVAATTATAAAARPGPGGAVVRPARPPQGMVGMGGVGARPRPVRPATGMAPAGP